MALPSATDSTGYVCIYGIKRSNQDGMCAEEIFGLLWSPFHLKTRRRHCDSNDSRFLAGLCGLDKDVGRAHRVADQVKAGTFWIN